MFQWLTDIFNASAYPKTITALPLGAMNASEIKRIHGRPSQYLEYSGIYDAVEIRAKRDKNNQYDIELQCQYIEGMSDVETFVMRCGLSLSDAINIIDAYDDKREKHLMRGIPESDTNAYRKKYLEPLYTKSHVSKVQRRQAKSRTFRH